MEVSARKAAIRGKAVASRSKVTHVRQSKDGTIVVISKPASPDETERDFAIDSQQSREIKRIVEEIVG